MILISRQGYIISIINKHTSYSDSCFLELQLSNLAYIVDIMMSSFEDKSI